MEEIKTEEEVKRVCSGFGEANASDYGPTPQDSSNVYGPGAGLAAAAKAGTAGAPGAGASSWGAAVAKPAAKASGDGGGGGGAGAPGDKAAEIVAQISAQVRPAEELILLALPGCFLRFFGGTREGGGNAGQQYVGSCSLSLCLFFWYGSVSPPVGVGHCITSRP